MTSREFCYWLQGVFEVADPKALDDKQTDLIKRHLAMVFVHEIDPSYPTAQQPALDAAHAGGTAHTKPSRPPVDHSHALARC